MFAQSCKHEQKCKLVLTKCILSVAQIFALSLALGAKNRHGSDQPVVLFSKLYSLKHFCFQWSVIIWYLCRLLLQILHLDFRTNKKKYRCLYNTLKKVFLTVIQINTNTHTWWVLNKLKVTSIIVTYNSQDWKCYRQIFCLNGRVIGRHPIGCQFRLKWVN